MKKHLPLPCYDIEKTASVTEMTGLIPFLPEDESQAESYESLYPIHRQQIVPRSPDPDDLCRRIPAAGRSPGQDTLFSADR